MQWPLGPKVYSNHRGTIIPPGCPHSLPHAPPRMPHFYSASRISCRLRSSGSERLAGCWTELERRAFCQMACRVARQNCRHGEHAARRSPACVGATCIDLLKQDASKASKDAKTCMGRQALYAHAGVCLGRGPKYVMRTRSVHRSTTTNLHA